MNGLLSKHKSSCGRCGSAIKCWKWSVRNILQNHHNKYAVVILNRTVSQNKEMIQSVWNNASIRITVDGGTVHWDKFTNSLSESQQKTLKLPDMIIGDFDSITDDVMQKYKKKGCKMEEVIAVAQTSGRIDQILGNIQTLHLAKENRLLHPNTRIYIMSDDSLSWLLQPGDHIIDIPEDSRRHKRAWCSLIPVGEACTNVTTSGLKWNLDNQELKFGKSVSTSNAFEGSEQVKVKCSHTLLWSMKVPGLTSK